MASDYADLQKLALSDKGRDEAVTVNQRALIDKILARYASENTTLRELLQNADDANATLVKIHYQTLSATPVGLEAMPTTPCRRVLVSNNGTPFREEDWTRLKRIAEGNPDAEKIGAFGVGFYSVFSFCDDPFVSSGSECMAFFWNDKDQLFVRRRGLEKKEEMTTFMLTMRMPTEIPNLPDLCRFLASSLTFTRCLCSIELYFDDYQLLTLHRQAAPDSSIPLRSQKLNLISPKRSMQVLSASLQPIQIKATYLSATQYYPSNPQTGFKKLFSRFAPPPVQNDPSKQVTAVAFLRIASAKVSITISQKFAAEFERAQKKPPPRETKIHMLCISKHELDASTHNDPVFADLIPKTQGRVYIGFPTHQTTGFGGHVGAPALVPTVERESIDLADAQLRVWNGELLGCVGIFARALYDFEMENLSNRVKPDVEDSVLVAEAIHVLNLFTFRATTPSNRVGNYIEEAFFSAAKDGTIQLLTNKGVKSSDVVRIATKPVPFLISTPILSGAIAVGAETFITKLRDADMIRSVSWEDVKAELNGRTISETHAVQLLKWLLQDNLPAETQKEVLSSAIVIVGDEKLGKVVNLGDIMSFNFPGKIPVEGGLPHYVLPVELGKTFSAKELGAFGWKELGVHEWIRFVCNNPPTAPAFDIEKSVEFATTVLSAASKNWDAISPDDRKDIVVLLSAKRCMPTVKKGLMKPAETYFHNVKVLPDLPLVESMRGVKEKFLEQLGVRRVVALQLIFDRLGEGGDWSHIDGIKYLASVQSNLSSEEFQKLRDYPLCPSLKDKKRMVVNQLYEPNRDLEKLDLPIISWPIDQWRATSAEARFLYALGLNRYPSVQTLIQIASKQSNTTEQRYRALDFFTTFYHTYVYNKADLSKVKDAFLPSEPLDGKVHLCSPSNIYSNPACKALGFYVLDSRFAPDATKFGVKSDPPSSAIENALIKHPPADGAEAREKFGYAAQRLGSFKKSELANLSGAKIIPVMKNGVTRHVQPSLCFFHTPQEKEDIDRIWQDIFDFVGFGDHANLFLEALGVKDKPDAAQIADQLSREPRRIYRTMDIQGYLKLLNMLGSNVTNLRRSQMVWNKLKAAECLVGLTTTIGEDGSPNTVATLARAEDIVIVDEPRLGIIFRSKLVVAPERDDCETLYMELGSPHLSSLVRQRYAHRGSPTSNAATEALRKHIIERAGIFLTLPEIAHQVKREGFLANNLRVQAYDSLQVERILIFGRLRFSDTEKVTACVDTSAKGCLLLVTDPAKVSFNQVAEALNSVILKKSNRGTDLMFETILRESLEFLRFRGFPVDRLINRQLEEQRLTKANWEADAQGTNGQPLHEPNGFPENGHVAGQQPPSPKEKKWKLKIPGSWDDDPDPPDMSSPPDQQSQHQPSRRALMSSIKNALGIQDPLGSNRPQATPPRRPADKSSIDRQLAYAVRAVRPSNESSIFSPPTSSIVREAPQSYCDTNESQNLTLYNHSPAWGIATFYVPHERQQFEETLAERQADFQSFAGLLKQLAIVFNARQDSFHIFFDTKGRTIAFNRQGSLFFNIIFFLELHVKHGGYTKDAPIYWFTVTAHELAHNMVNHHGADHSYWTEAFVTSYMLKLWETVGQT